jgi:GntR family transcriptional regulator/MocR family aminotransferase
MRALYEGRRAALRDSLARHAPDVELGGLAAGFHAVARLPKTIREKALVSAARATSIGLYGMSRYRSTGKTRPTELVISFGNLSERLIERGIAAVAKLIRASDRG